MPGLFHPDAEIGVARAAEATGTLYCLSTMASCSIEEVAASTAAPKLFQLYIFRDRGVTRDLLMRAKAAGYRSEEHTSELQSLMRISYAVFCLKTKKHKTIAATNNNQRQ